MIKIKLAAIYKIEHKTGYYYIGMTIDFANRIGQHITNLKLKRHSSTKLQELWNTTKPEEWTFSILEYISLSEFKKTTQLKGKQLQNKFRRLLLNKEKEWMKQHSINWCLNKNDKNFS